MEDGEDCYQKLVKLQVISIRINDSPFTPAGANGKYGATESDYGMKSKVAYPNNRSSTICNPIPPAHFEINAQSFNVL